MAWLQGLHSGPPMTVDIWAISWVVRCKYEGMPEGDAVSVMRSATVLSVFCGFFADMLPLWLVLATSTTSRDGQSNHTSIHTSTVLVAIGPRESV